MALTELGRRLGTWLGVEPDDAVGDEFAPRGSRAISAGPAVEEEIAELRRLIAELTSGLDHR